MRKLSSRTYEGEKDFQIMLELLTSIRPPDYLDDYPAKVDIEENLMSAAVRANTRLWFEQQQPVGWAYVDEFNNLRWEIAHPYEDAISAEVVQWGEASIRKARGENKRTTLDASCREDCTERISFLQRHGFFQTQDTTLYMIRPLSEPIPEPVLPPGFIVRPIAGLHEAEEVASMHRAAFGTNYMTTENRLAIMNTNEYDMSLDLVVVAPGGMIAANCICSANEQRKIGSTDPIGTHPRYQRMGLARALLATGLQLLKERGMLSAQLGTSGENIAMRKTAESVGFTIHYKTIWFSKEVN